MNIKSFLLSLISLMLITQAQAEQIIHIKNHSSFFVRFTIPKCEKDAPSTATAQSVMLQPNELSENQITIVIPDGVSHFWMNLPPQPLCHEGRCSEEVTLEKICVMANPEPVYDLYVSIATRHLMWFAALFCNGCLNEPKITQLLESHVYTRPRETGCRRMCFPIYSKRPEAKHEDAMQEAIKISHIFNAIRIGQG